MPSFTVSRWPNDRHQYVVFTGSAASTFTLPDAYTTPGISYIFKNQGTGTATIAASNNQTIDGAASYTLSEQYSEVTVFSDGANWNVVYAAGNSGGGSGTPPTAADIEVEGDDDTGLAEGDLQTVLVALAQRIKDLEDAAGG
jgi:hypothetical protein